jgi:conjugative relaxase-like TrwC/TraI family protein
MQTTHKIPGDSATTYAQYLTSTASRGDYYTRDGGDERDRPVPSRWHGSQQILSSLGLSAEGPVERGDLRAVMQGFSPLDGGPLRPAGSDGTRTAGVELMMAPPKTVSALWATVDPYRRAQIEAAHRQAVASALRRTEREVTLVRRKTKGVVRFEKAKSLLAAEFVHTSSRLAQDQETGGIPDPQLHSHLIVFAAERKDGKLAAVESKQLYKSARENGAWYRAELAQNLQSLGLQIERRTGKNERYFELSGVPEELAGHWSSRSEDVDRAARVFRQRYGREPQAGELGSLTTSTRGSKTSADRVDVNDAWRAIGEEHGLTSRDAEELFNDRNIDNQPKVDLASELLSEVTRERSMITGRELRAKAYELSAGVCRPAQADRLVNELARSGELVRLKDRTWTTRRLREMEQSTVEIAERRASENTARVSESSLKQARHEIGREIKGSLTQEQKQALQTITGPGGITVLVGRAGAGKGVTISAATRAWQLEGNEVIGTAIAGATAKRLQADAKLDRSTTTDSLLGQVEKGNIRLDSKTVVVMDEAGMADSDRLARLVKATGQRESKLVLAGDSAQLGSIGAGGLFKEIEGKVPTAELTEVHRARHEWERKAWEHIRAGEPGPALAQYQAHDRLHIHHTRAEAAAAMVENWDQTRRHAPDRQAVMITDASNKERDQMNAMAQERRAQAGELGAHRVELPGKPYGLASGDEIIFTGQYRIPGSKRVENGITGTILDTSHREGEDRVTIKTQEREPREVDVDTSKFSDLSLAYAVHVHKAQGLTAETSGILTGAWQTDKETAYVAVSRAREQTQIYVAREDLGEQGMDTGAIERLAERMQRSRAQEASITRQVAERPIDTPEQVDEITRPNQIAEQTIEHPELERSAQIAEPTATHSAEMPSRSNATQGTESEIDEVLKARRGRQFEWERAIDVDRSGDVSEQAREIQAIENLAEQLRGEGAGEATITKEIAKQTAGREADLERNTQAQAEHERYIDKLLEQQRQRLLDAEAPREIDRHRDTERDPDTKQVEQASREPEQVERTEKPERDPYIEQAIQQARDRQQAWEQGIDPDRDNDRGYGIE